MLIVERLERLLQILKQQRTAQLDDLARHLGVSSSTVRRDLQQLENRGLVERTRAGAIFKESNQSQTALAERMREQVEAKKSIGRFAAALVKPQMTVLLDGGSTVVYAAQQITARPIQVVTNSLLIANLFAEDEQVELVLLGGILYPRTGVTLGSIAIGCLADLHADLLMFSLAGIYGQETYNINLTMAQVEQQMLRQATYSLLLMDSSKFGRKSLVRVCDLADVDRIVTDEAVDTAWRQSLGDRLVVAST